MEDKVVVKEEEHNYGNNLNMLLQGPFEFVEDVVRAILRCLGLRLDDNECSYVVVIPPITCSITHVSNSSASDNSEFHETTTTTTTITDGVPGQEQKQEEKEKEKEEICVPSQTPVHVSADGIDDASSNADSGSTKTTAITTDSGEEEEEEEEKQKEETCPASQTPDSGASDVGGDYPGTLVDQPGIGPARPSPVQVSSRIKTKITMRKPPRPGVSTGQGGQIH